MRTIRILKYAFSAVGAAMVAGALFWAQHVRSFVSEASRIPAEARPLDG